MGYPSQYQLDWEKQSREVKENWRALGELAGGSRGTGGVGRLSGRRDPEWEGVAKAGRIRSVQWEANPKGGMEGVAGGVDKMSRL